MKNHMHVPEKPNHRVDREEPESGYGKLARSSKQDGGCWLSHGAFHSADLQWPVSLKDLTADWNVIRR